MNFGSEKYIPPGAKEFQAPGKNKEHLIKKSMKTEQKVTHQEMEKILLDRIDKNSIDEENRITIDRADDRESLYDAIEEIGEIKGTEKNYDAKTLITLAEKVLDGEIDSNVLPRTHGFRDKVKKIRGEELTKMGLALEGKPADRLDHPDKLF